MEIVARTSSTHPLLRQLACQPRCSVEARNDGQLCVFGRRLAGLIPLTAQDQAALEGLMVHIKPVDPHTVLVEQECVSDHALVIFAGFACRHKRRGSGRRQIVSFLLPGDRCDRGAVDGYSLDHTIETLTHCRVAKVPRAIYLDVLDRHPRVALALQRARLVKEAVAREWMVSLGTRSGVERTAHLLCELMERLGSIGQASDGRYDLPLTQGNLADALGLSNIHVNRSLQVLRRAGLILLKGGHLQILAPQRLCQLAEFEPKYL